MLSIFHGNSSLFSQKLSYSAAQKNDIFYDFKNDFKNFAMRRAYRSKHDVKIVQKLLDSFVKRRKL